jgi:hypothetical protein
VKIQRDEQRLENEKELFKKPVKRSTRRWGKEKRCNKESGCPGIEAQKK